MPFVSTHAKIAEAADAFNFSHYGCAPVETPVSLSLYKNWLNAGHHATMDYLVRHLPIKEKPERLMPRALSAIVVAKSYFPHPYPSQQILAARTALYASGEDYHLEFQAELEAFKARLLVEFPGEEFLCFADSAPVLERDLAVRAGLGWIGKNGCVIHPKNGSLFFIGEIFTSLATGPAPAQIPDMCGTCDRCLRACPTQALVAPGVLDANKCIAYWTIEARTPAPVELREKFGDWFFGCDICQTVCPWNEKVFGREQMQNLSQTPAPQTASLPHDLRAILTSQNRDLRERFQTLPYLRARALGLKRNALYVIGNLRLLELEPEVRASVDNPDLKELAKWALAHLMSERLRLPSS